jgi:hypothetical protein
VLVGAGGFVAVGGTGVAVGVAPQAANAEAAATVPPIVKNWRRLSFLLIALSFFCVERLTRRSPEIGCDRVTGPTGRRYPVWAD